MDRLNKFIALTSTERRLLVRTALLLYGMWFAFLLLPFPTLRRAIARLTPANGRLLRPSPTYIETVVRAVATASRYVPSATCLIQSLVAKILLARYGHLSNLHIGVVKGKKGEFQAHAWLECAGRIVIGDSGDLSRYTLLPSIDSETQ